ncbi:hypothetical protein AB0M34_24610 [Nocardia sp. NPDC050193]
MVKVPFDSPPDHDPRLADDKIDYARLLREQGNSLAQSTSKAGILKTSLSRYLTLATERSCTG